MRGYKYINEIDAINAVESVNSVYTFNGVTNKFVDYIQIEDFYFIIYFEELKQYLGNPIEIQINNLSHP